MEQLEQVMRQYADTVYRLALAHTHHPADAEDIFQDVFLKYAEKHPVFASEEHRKAWLLRVTINRCRSLDRSNWWKRLLPLEEAVHASAMDDHDPELALALTRLPPKYRTVIHLHYFENYNTSEIAALTRQQPSTVRAQLTRARQMLAVLLKGDQDA